MEGDAQSLFVPFVRPAHLKLMCPLTSYSQMSAIIWIFECVILE